MTSFLGSNTPLVDFDQKSLASTFQPLPSSSYNTNTSQVAAAAIAFNPIFWKYVPFPSPIILPYANKTSTIARQGTSSLHTSSHEPL